MTKKLADPYIRQAVQFDDGHFIVLCQFKQQSGTFFTVPEIHADKTFHRNHCQEFEINTFNQSTK